MYHFTIDVNDYDAFACSNPIDFPDNDGIENADCNVKVCKVTDVNPNSGTCKSATYLEGREHNLTKAAVQSYNQYRISEKIDQGFVNRLVHDDIEITKKDGREVIQVSYPSITNITLEGLDETELPRSHFTLL